MSGKQPLYKCIWRATRASRVTTMIGQRGRKRATTSAVLNEKVDKNNYNAFLQWQRTLSCVPADKIGTLRSEEGDCGGNVAGKVNSCYFNLHRDYSKSLTFSIPKNHIQVQKERGNFVVACVLPLYNLKLGSFTS